MTEMTTVELKRKIVEMTNKHERTSSPYLKSVYAEQRGRYEHELKRQAANKSKGGQHGQITKQKNIERTDRNRSRVQGKRKGK